MTTTHSSSITRRIVLKALAGAGAIGGVSAVTSATTGTTERRTQTEEDDDEHERETTDPTEICDFTRLAEEAMDSVVTIRVFDEEAREFVQGSGWVYDVDGSTANVVTNWHVMFAARGADARFGGGDWRPVTRPLGADPYSDLAVLQVEDVPEYVEPLSVVDTPPEQGETVAALGAPIGLDQTITTGVVSAVDRSTTVSFEHFMYNVPSTIQIDAATNPGNSGGPLIDCRGDVVGVNFAGTAPTIAENINFSVSSTMIDRIVPELIDTGTFNHPYVGIHGITVSPMLSRLNDVDETTQGVYVEQTVDGYPGDTFLQGSSTADRETGIPIGGDVIVAVNGTSIDDADALRNFLFEETHPEEMVTVTFYRDGSQYDIDVPLESRPTQLERVGVREPTM